MTFRTCSILAALVLAIGAAASQGQKMTSEQINQYVQHLMSIHVGFLNGVPPGVSVEVKQVSRTGASGKDLVVKYHIFVRGVPPETLFQELNWPVTAEKPSSELGGISAGK